MLAAGHTVTAVVRRPEQQRWVPADAHIVSADCLDTPRMNELLGAQGTFVHVAGILLGPALARLPRIADPERLIVVSSAAIHSAHRASASAYREGERALLEARPDAVLLRPTMIYGSERDRNIHHVLAFARRFRFLPLVGTGTGLVQPVHFEDVAAAVAALVEGRVEGPLEIGGASPLTLRSAAETVLRAVGTPDRIVRLPYLPALGAARLVDRLRGSRIAERIERMLEDRTIDNSSITAATGIHPRAFETGIRQQAAAGPTPFAR